jgi:hypothetical protein
VRHHVHAHVHGVDHASEFDHGATWQLGIAAVLEDIKVGAGGSSTSNAGIGAGSGCPSSGSARTVEIS